MTTTVVPPTARTASPDVTFDRLYTVLAGWLVAGLFLDGWAHTHVPTLESFFTPWHAVMYSGFLACFAALGVRLARNRSAGWRGALPPGYLPSLVGCVIFLAGGLFDMGWHELLGIEASLSALLSPAHLLLATGFFLIVSGPARAALGQSTAPWTALLSVGYVLALLVFFTQYLHPMIHAVADRPTGEDLQALGIAGMLVQVVILAGACLYVVTRWRAPLGAFTLLVALPLLLGTALTWQPNLLAVGGFALLIGLLTDGLYVLTRPRADRRLHLQVFAFVAPVLFAGLYFLALSLVRGLYWNVNLWLGTIVLSGLTGLLLSHLIPGRNDPLRD